MTGSAAESLHACRTNLGPAPRTFDFGDKRRYLRIPLPEWIAAAEPLREILWQQNTLLREGRLVWASLVQADERLFLPGDHDHPSTVIYSPDAAAFDDHPERLRAMARALYALNSGGHEDPAPGAFAAMLADETPYLPRTRVPKDLAGDDEVYRTHIIVCRRHLPDGVLRHALFPLLVHPDLTPRAMMLPSRYWPPELAH
ncbi:hypothetical protein ACFWU3_26370 [Streptomyces sp. NPDC058685]|uniref:hypothetical protein n=1 Tax=Streptomyces sp. NPDC058685 TaxID=3346598 RepID=UPI003647C550